MKRYSLGILVAVTSIGSVASYADSSFGEFGLADDAAQRIYAVRCASCHGEDARGRGDVAPDFSAEWSRLLKSDSELAGHIRNGYQSRTAKKFYSGGSCPAQELSDDEIRRVLTYMRGMVGL